MLVSMVLKERFGALLLMSFNLYYIMFEEQLQFWKFPLICKGGGTIMVCSTLTKAHFTSEQSLSFPLCIACSV